MEILVCFAGIKDTLITEHISDKSYLNAQKHRATNGIYGKTYLYNNYNCLMKILSTTEKGEGIAELLIFKNGSSEIGVAICIILRSDSDMKISG